MSRNAVSQPAYHCRSVPVRLTVRLVLQVILTFCILPFQGCFPLPFPESPANHEQKDFRKMFGDTASRSRFHTGQTFCPEIESVLGPPPFATKDGRSIAYTLDVNYGLLINPLCFYAGPNNYAFYAVRLDFDANDVFVRWILRRYEAGNWWVGLRFDDYYDDAMQDLRVGGSKLEPKKPCNNHATTLP